MPIPSVDPVTDSSGLVKGIVGKLAMSPSGQWYLRHISPRVDPTLMRRMRGRVSSLGTWPRCVLLTHTGAKSGTPRVSPLAYQRIGDSYAIFASRAGSPANPDWLYNVVAHPDTTIEIGTETVSVMARVAEPAERDVLWDRQKRRVPQFAEYEKKAAPRKIPVIVLDPVR